MIIHASFLAYYSVPEEERGVLGAYTACVFTRHLARVTFHDSDDSANSHRAMLASDMVQNIGRIFRYLEIEWKQKKRREENE